MEIFEGTRSCVRGTYEYVRPSYVGNIKRNLERNRVPLVSKLKILLPVLVLNPRHFFINYLAQRSRYHNRLRKSSFNGRTPQPPDPTRDSARKIFHS
jgi:hypothetical protein